MKKRIGLTIITILMIMMPIVFAEDTDTIYVTDTQELLNSDTTNYIIEANKSLEEQTGAQIAVAIVNGTGRQTTENYATDKFNSMTIGDSEKNNGVLLLVSTKNSEVRIAVGVRNSK